MKEATETLKQATTPELRPRFLREAPCYALVYPELECQFCGKVGPDVEAYHQNTQYVDAESNYVAACPPCREQNDEYWRGMWDDYYSNCM